MALPLKRVQLGIVLFLLLLPISSALALAPRASSQDVFGIIIGGNLTLPNCTYSQSGSSCAYYNSVLRETSGEAFLPVSIASTILPSHVNPTSVRLLSSNGVVIEVRYSVFGNFFKDGENLYYALVRQYGKKFQKEESLVPDQSMPKMVRVVALKAQWQFPELQVQVDARETRSGEDFATVTITKK